MLTTKDTTEAKVAEEARNNGWDTFVVSTNGNIEPTSDGNNFNPNTLIIESQHSTVVEPNNTNTFANLNLTVIES